jgi:hypothetical protein
VRAWRRRNKQALATRLFSNEIVASGSEPATSDDSLDVEQNGWRDGGKVMRSNLNRVVSHGLLNVPQGQAEGSITFEFHSAVRLASDLHAWTASGVLRATDL